MCSASPPSPPDYKGAAQTQGSAEIQAAIANAIMNRPQQNTPLGSQSWTQTGTAQVPAAGGLPAFSVPTYQSDIKLSPQGERLYGKALDTQENLLEQAQRSLSQPMQANDIKELTDRAYATMTSRLDPQWSQAKTSEETKLINQGLRPGAEAYDNAMRVFGQAQNDAYQQAGLASLAYSPQLLQQQIAMRVQPLNELQALQSGAQVGMPQFGGAAPTNLNAPNYQTALGQQASYLQGLYNADAQQAASMNAGLATLAGALIGLSDRRLKSNIVRVGTHRLGIAIYEYDILGERQRGVMADEVLEVRPEAVLRTGDGWLMVNYGAL